MRTTSRTALAALGFAVLFSCNHGVETGTGVRRVALLPGNVLVAKPGWEWLRAGVPLLLSRDLQTGKQVVATITDPTSDSTAQESVRITINGLPNNVFEVVETTSDIANQRTSERQAVTINSPDDLIGALNEIAKKIDPASVPFGTTNLHAWHEFTSAMLEHNPQARLADLQQATQADPSFGLAYLSAVPLTRDATEARAHESSFDALSRSQLELLNAELVHAPVGRLAELNAQVVALAPNDLQSLLAGAKAQVLAGATEQGRNLYGRALAIGQGNPNVHLQVAEGLVSARDFAGAVRALEGVDANESVVTTRAIALLLGGQQARASAAVDAFLANRGSETAAVLMRVEWDAASKGLSAASGPQQPIFEAQQAIWKAATGDYAGAQSLAQESVTSASDALSKQLAAIALLVSKSNGPVEQVEAAVRGLSIPTQGQPTLLAYALFIGGHYAEASDAWTRIVNESGDTLLPARAMLASSLQHAGRSSTTKVQPFVPVLSGADQFSVLAFTEMRRLLAH